MSKKTKLNVQDDSFPVGLFIQSKAILWVKLVKSTNMADEQSDNRRLQFLFISGFLRLT